MDLTTLNPDERAVRIIDCYLTRSQRDKLDEFECQYIHAPNETELLRVLNLHEQRQIRYGVKE